MIDLFCTVEWVISSGRGWSWTVGFKGFLCGFLFLVGILVCVWLFWAVAWSPGLALLRSWGGEWGSVASAVLRLGADGSF